MIDIRKLKELVRLMVANELTELDLRDSEEQVTLRRGGPQSANVGTVTAFAPAALASASPVEVASPSVGIAGDGRGGVATAVDDTLVHIESPMVGTFFSAPNPDAAPFATAGTTVGPDTTVCIIEAMKIFNEIKAECSGTIERVLVKNGEAVQFGQPLFSVRTG